MDQYIGKMLDNRYELLEVVGTGGMAVVYKALCHRLNRYVAVKILKEDIAADPDLRRRFHDESQAVAMLSHPNIVAVYDVSKTADLEYIVMELIDGITLKQYMKQKGGRLPWKEALHFITQIMRALRHAHGRGIIHRDIKPHNIMVLRDGSVKVADFGIARVATSQNTMTQQALGSVHYISPEQAKGSRVDARSDIYSAGVVLYEMLTGKLPYEGDSPVAVAIQHINSVPTPPHEVNPSIPKGLEQITMKAMASNPNDRYPSSAAMLEDLDAFRRNPELVFNYSIPAVSGGKGRSSDGIDSTQYAHRTDGDRRASTPRTRPHRNSDNYGDDEEERSARTPRKGSSKTKTKPRKSRTNPYVIGVAVVIVVFLAAVTAFALSNLRGIGGKGEEHTVPSLVGMIYDEAVLQYGDEFEIEIEDTQIDDTLTVGTILEQTPNGGDIRKGDKPTIKVVVSAHTDSTPMPNVVGKKQTDAIDELVAAGIPVGNIDVSQRVYSDEYDTGEVINSDPSAGMPITSSTKVSLTISKGKAPVIVPSFLGLSRTVVAAQLKELGLVGDFTMVDSDEEAGTILTQSIDANTEVEEGTVIRFTVSNGPKESESPSPSPDESPSASPSASTEPSTSPSPSASTSPSASPSQEPTTSSGVVVDKTITISLPQQDGDVFVKVEVNGTTVYGRNEDCAQGSIQVPLSGSGTQTVNVYFDGVLHESYPVDFS